MKLLVGTYTGKGSDGIYSLDFDPASGTLSNEKLLVHTNNPSFLTYDHSGNFVFSVNEGREGRVSSFKWNPDKSALMPVNEQSSEGSSPCSIELNGEGNLLAVANYGSGNVAVYTVNDDSRIHADPTVFQHEGSGPVL
ncbi:MAG: beta-propeller fold lactonase family protein, partial [Saprospiraceae bacterium]|nr:beta-propeller fold lactonase family protein [Saprospiraceae bacterium]